MSLASEFKEFAMKGSVIDLAVGVVIGAAFGKIVSSLVGDVLMPPIGYALGNVDFKDLAVTLRPEAAGKPAIIVSYGKFLQSLIDFAIIALCVFFLVKVVNRLQRPTPEPPKGPSDEVQLLTEIRDLLKTSPAAAPAAPPAAT